MAVLGYPVAHSRSPAMQSAALEAMGLAPQWTYEAIEVEPDRFRDLIDELPGRGFAGVNVTIPHKEAALALADEAGEEARAIGAANTLVFSDGRVRAENTDAGGFLDSLPNRPGGIHALVLGAGGAARAVVWALDRAGAEVQVWNRDSARAEGLVSELGGVAVTDFDQRSADLVVNATSVGLAGESRFGELPLDSDAFRPGQVVVDLVYGQDPGDLIDAAARAGATTVDGLEILVGQGARSLEIWTGSRPDLKVMRAAARSAAG